MRVAIVGASGFIGVSLLKALTGTYQCQALSRSRPRLDDGEYDWAPCDLHNLRDLEKSLSGCDVAIYLVHSMLASAGLNQGNFQDFDISLADNFARAARTCGVKRVIYLSGLIPDGKRSTHLESRLEVESLLRTYYPDVTILRAGIIAGSRGSSFSMMYRLSKKLPLMLLPSWTETLSQPVYVDDVVLAIEHCLSQSETSGHTYDLGSEPPLSYETMMKMIGKKVAREPKIVHIDTFSPTLSSLWITLISGAPLELTRPLVGSLKQPMLVRDQHRLKIPGHRFVSFAEALDKIFASKDIESFRPPHAFRSWFRKQSGRQVRSIQRLSLPKGWTADDVAHEYLNWLPRAMRYIISVRVEDNCAYFYINHTRIDLLKLQYSAERSEPTRSLFYIKGGILAHKQKQRGRLEFRQLPHEDSILAAIHDYVPALPWMVYRFSQAIIHGLVMRQFTKHLFSAKAKLPVARKHDRLAAQERPQQTQA
ncbi:NAD-dependent epimerase/dehydratase family protein [Pseudobacteriovorax antillogorgiicola]|uniref:Nucleoside-diphosphate-sugar epimerase n=1 Tax=Pseudobacteriovorax antillogorgiicola TaxID=1513793 RepID=A0A1Y6CBS3_9BACT|nr:NAD(P)H-binding protein [Pseudobacteriovorax antillogorgiicola]TCS48979.1 nucleoside-diphosphate-sugar epimerase [Pseudobacteriovorax antillogorgiicola]SMF53519.1 Nucleoside-diphosphate-sugar epimerase [Pseudobacteriovorax antillogorgiicola]